jgi:hypothetical protein
MTKWPVILGAALVFAAGVSTLLWQEMRVRHATAESQQLRAQVADLQASQAKGPRPTIAEADLTELERLRTEQAAMQGEIARLRGRLGATLRSNATMTALSAAGKNENEASPISAAMTNIMRSTLEMQFLGKLPRLKAKLNLTPEQEQAVREILQKQMDQAAEAAQKMLSGKSSLNDIMKRQVGQPNMDEQIQALLTPEQSAAYKEYKQEETANQARSIATSEVLQMHSTLGLTQEQQDQAYTALYQLSMDQQSFKDTPPTGGDKNATAQWIIDRKVKALENILTPEQLQNYRQYTEKQTKAILSVMPMGGPKAE